MKKKDNARDFRLLRTHLQMLTTRAKVFRFVTERCLRFGIDETYFF